MKTTSNTRRKRRLSLDVRLPKAVKELKPRNLDTLHRALHQKRPFLCEKVPLVVGTTTTRSTLRRADLPVEAAVPRERHHTGKVAHHQEKDILVIGLLQVELYHTEGQEHREQLLRSSQVCVVRCPTHQQYEKRHCRPSLLSMKRHPPFPTIFIEKSRV